MAGIKHKKVVTKPNRPEYDVSADAWNDEHTIDDNSIPVSKLSGHDKEAHDSLLIDAGTLQGMNVSQIRDHEPKAHTHAESQITNLVHDAIKIKGKVVDDTQIGNGKMLVYVSASDKLVYSSINAVNALAVGGNSLGTSSVLSSGTVFLMGGDNITLSQSGNSITILGASSSSGLQGISASNTSFTSGVVVLTGSNMVTVKTGTGQRVIIDASQSVQTQNMVTVNNSTGQIFIVGGNNITVSNTNNSIYVIAGDYLTTAMPVNASTMFIHASAQPYLTNVSATFASNAVSLSVHAPQTGISGLAAGTTTATSGTVSFANANGISFGLNGNTVTASHNALTTAMQSNAGIYSSASLNLTNISATLASNAVSLSVGNYLTTAMPSNAGLYTTASLNLTNASVTLASNAVSLSVHSPQTGISGVAAGTTTATSGTVSFSNANGISFGLNGNTITASHNALTTAMQSNAGVYSSASLNLTNISATLASNAVSLSVGNYLTTAMPSNAGVYTSASLNLTNVSATLGSNAISLSVGNYLTTAMPSNAGVYTSANLYLTNASATLASNAVSVSVHAPQTGISGVIAGTGTVTSGTLSFSNANGISFGINGQTVTASHNALTTAMASNAGLYTTANLNLTNASMTLNSNALSLSVHAPQTGISGVLAGTGTLTSGTVSFANSNGISFGLNGSVLTASHNALTTAMASDAGVYTSASLHLTNISVTLGSNAVSISVAPPGTGEGGGVAIKGSGTSVASTGTVVFSNGNGITFGLSDNVMTASHNGLTTAMPPTAGVYTSASLNLTNASLTLASDAISLSVHAPQTGISGISADGLFSSGTVRVTGSGIVSVYTSSPQTLVISASQSTQPAVGSLNGSSGTLSIAAGNMMSVSNTASTISIINLMSSATTASRVESVNVVGTGSRFALEGHQHAGLWQLSVTGNTAGSSSAGAGSFCLAGGQNVTLSCSTAPGGKTISFVAPTFVGGISAPGSLFTSGTVVFTGSNNITVTASGANQTIIISGPNVPTAYVSSINNSSGSVTISAGNLMSVSNNASTIQVINLLSSSNIAMPVSSVSSAGTLSSRYALADHIHEGAAYTHTHGAIQGYNVSATSASNGLTLSVAPPGAAAEANWINLTGNTAGQTTISGSTIVLEAGNNVTLSGVNASRIRIDAGGGGGLSYQTVPVFTPMDMVFTSVGTIPQGSLSLRPVFIPFAVTATAIRLAMSVSVATASNSSSAGQNWSGNVAIYTVTGSTLSRLVSGSTVESVTYSSNATASVTGMRAYSVPLTVNLTPGLYWIAAVFSTNTIGQTSLAQTRTLYGNDRLPNAAGALNIPLMGQATTQMRPVYPWMGVYTAATSACPVSIVSSDINFTSASNPLRANFWFELAGTAYV